MEKTVGRLGKIDFRADIRDFITRLKEDELVSDVIGSAGSSLAARLTGMGLSMLAQVMLAQLLGSTDFGDYAYVTTWMAALSLFGRFGFDIATVKFVADYKAKGKWHLLRGLLRRSLQVSLLASAVVVTVMAFLLRLLHHSEFLEDHLVSLFWIASPMLPAISLLSIQNGILRGDGQPALAVTLQYLISPLAIIMFLLLFALVGAQLTSRIAVVVNVCALILVVILQRFFIWRSFSTLFERTSVCFADKEWFGAGFSMSVTSGVQQAMRRADVLAVGAFVGTEEAGIYSVVVRMLQMVRLGLLIMNIASAHLFSQLHELDNRDELQKVVSLVAKLSFLSTLPIIIGLFVWGSSLLALFGEPFGTGFLALRLLLVGESINIITGPTNILMNMIGQHKEMARFLIVTLIVDLCLIGILVPNWRLIGAAVATSISTIIVNVTTAVHLWRLLKVNSTVFSRKFLMS
jgi:O-antigen/teichoic acid export membrane protein